VLDKAEITRQVSAGSPPLWTLDVKVTAKSTIDVFEHITLEEAQTWYQHDPRPYDEALRRARLLREPERSTTLEQQPKLEQTNRIYRKSLTAGEPFTFTTQVTAERKSGGWEFFSDPLHIQMVGLTRLAFARGDLPRDSLLIDRDQENALTKLFAEQKRFVELVKQSEVEMAARLTREHQQLVAASRLWHAWRMDLPMRNGPPLRVRCQFLPRTAEDRLAVLISNVDHAEERSVWTGQLELAAAPEQNDRQLRARPEPDGWSMSFAPAVAEEQSPLNDRITAICLAPDSKGRLVWLRRPEPPVLVEDPNPPILPPHDQLVRKITDGATPGQVWEGILQYKGQAAERVRMTITERRNEGHYLRAVVELVDSPFVNAVFEGTVSTTVEAAYGIPIRLVRRTTAGPGTYRVNAIPLFSQGVVSPVRIQLADSLDGKHDLSGSHLNLAIAKPVGTSAPHRDQWEQALQPGTQWSGTMTFGQQPASRITITVAEVRDQGKYVRLTAVDPTMPNRFRVFEGALNSSDDTIDGYALTVTGLFPTPLPTQHDSGSNRDIFGRGKAPQQFRLLPDGQTMVGISFSGQLEKLMLKKDEQKVEQSLLREDMAKLWRQQLTRDSRWRGPLTNLGANQTTEVELHVTSDVDPQGNLTATIMVPGQPQSKVDFAGTLRPDTSETANGYALTLIKKSSGVPSKSPVLGNVTRGKPTIFRIGTTGSELIGYAQQSVNELGPEVLELKRVP